MKKIILAGIITTALMTSIIVFNTASAQENTVPSWIKNTVGFWVEGAVSDTEFLNAMQFLITEGIIQVPQPVEAEQPAFNIVVGEPIETVADTMTVQHSSLECPSDHVMIGIVFSQYTNDQQHMEISCAPLTVLKP